MWSYANDKTKAAHQLDVYLCLLRSSNLLSLTAMNVPNIGANDEHYNTAEHGAVETIDALALDSRLRIIEVTKVTRWIVGIEDAATKRFVAVSAS